MSDEELIKEGKKMRWLSGDGKDRYDDTECVSRAVEDLQSGMAKKASEAASLVPNVDDGSTDDDKCPTEHHCRGWRMPEEQIVDHLKCDE